MEKHPDFERYWDQERSCYFAGFPGYPRNFSRDVINTGILSLDKHLLSNQLHYSAELQGKKFDHITGEEPGKIHHEYPGVEVHFPYQTTFNACDTTALYLMGLEFLNYLDKEKSDSFLAKNTESIEAAIGYLERHTDDDNLFWEYPPPGAHHFSLHTTYWKDSIVPSVSGKEEPTYPVVYALAQFQAARGFLSAGRMLNRKEYLDKADIMYRAGIENFIKEDSFCVEQDMYGRLEQASSDELHSLAYIPEEYKELLPLNAVEQRAKELITPIGVACTPKEISNELSDTYHGYVVWIFEQAFIHYAANKFGLDGIKEATLLCRDHIAEGQELLAVDPNIEPKGNNHQLWSVAAKIYFSNEPSLSKVDWL